MYSASSFWPAGVPDTLWQFGLLVPESRRNFPFVGIAVSWEFIVAFIAGCALICVFAWKRFSEPSYDVTTQAFRDFRELTIWNLKDSVSLRRAYVVYCISLVFIYATFAFFGRMIVQLFNQWNVSGLQISVGTIEFDSWKWPLFLALGISGFAPLINPLVPAENWLRRFSHEVVGIPTRIREKAVRIRTLIDGAPSEKNARPTSDWVKASLGPKLNGAFGLEKHLHAVVDWSYKEHVEWSDPEIRRKLNEYERNIREETESALDEFLYLTNPAKVPDSAATQEQGRLQQFEKRLAASVSALEQARDKFAIIMAIYCEHGSRFGGMRKGALKESIVAKLADVREPSATGLPLYAFVLIFIVYVLAVRLQWHPLISSIPFSDQAVLTTAALETLKVFLLVWMPAMAVATAASVMGPDRGERSVKESRLWAMIPGAIAAFVVGAAAMTLYAMLYAALPASNIVQMQQTLLGTGRWTGALPYFLLFAPTAVFCFLFVAAVRTPEQPPGFWLTVAFALMAAGLTVLYLGWVVSFTAWASAPCLRDPGPSPVSIWQVLGGSIPNTRWSLGREDLETCFAYYSTLDVLIISAAVFLSVLGLAQLRSRKPAPLVEAGKEEPSTSDQADGLKPVASAFLAGAIALLACGGGIRAHAEEVVLGFRTDIQPFSYLGPVEVGREQRPYFGYMADLCYEIFDHTGYELVQVPVTADSRFRVVRRPDGVVGPADTVGGTRVRRADGVPGPPDTEGGKKVDVLCDATTLRLDDPQRMEAGVFSPIVFVTGVSYLWRSVRRFEDVELGYIDNSTARRVAMEACKVDALRLGTDDPRPACKPLSTGDCLAKAAETSGSGSAPRRPTQPLRVLTQTVPSYILCPKSEHTELIEWFCAETGRDKVYFGDRDIILAKLADWRARGHECDGVRDPQQSYTYEPYALLVSRANPELFRFVQRRIYELFSHRSGAEALFYKWFPGQTMSEPLAWLFVLNGVMDQDELLAGPKQFPDIERDLALHD